MPPGHTRPAALLLARRAAPRGRDETRRAPVGRVLRSAALGL
jgi:hypothetical protein